MPTPGITWALPFPHGNSTGPTYLHLHTDGYQSDESSIKVLGNLGRAPAALGRCYWQPSPRLPQAAKPLARAVSVLKVAVLAGSSKICGRARVFCISRIRGGIGGTCSTRLFFKKRAEELRLHLAIGLVASNAAVTKFDRRIR